LGVIFRWQRNHNTFSSQRGWLSTNPRRSSAGSLPGEIDDLTTWQEFWESDQESRNVEMAIIRKKPTETKESPSALKIPDFEIPHATGPDLTKVGPR